MKALLEAHNLTVSYPAGASRKEVFRGVDLSLKEGGFLSILGLSGCGKTTLQKTLAGFHKPDSGTVTHRGMPITGPERTRLMIFQEFQQLFPWMTVIRNTAFPLRFTGFSRQNREKIARDYLERVGMAGREASFPYELSGGMKQRTALARALVTRPDVLLMDEPFASLDTPARKNLRSLLSGLWGDLELSVIFVTHDIEEALMLSDEIILLSSEGAEKITPPLSRPRDEKSEAFREFHEKLYRKISGL